MDRNFKIAHRMAAGQVAHRVAGEEQDRSGFSRCLPQLAQSVSLIGRQPVFQKVDVVGHPGSCFRLSSRSQVSDVVTVRKKTGRDCKPVH